VHLVGLTIEIDTFLQYTSADGAKLTIS